MKKEDLLGLGFRGVSPIKLGKRRSHYGHQRTKKRNTGRDQSKM